MTNYCIQSFFGKLDSLVITRVQDIYNCISSFIVVMPHISQLGLSPNIPNCKLEILVVNFLNIESNSRNWIDWFIKFELIEDCGLASCIQPEHQNLCSHVWESGKEVWNDCSHLCFVLWVCLLMIILNLWRFGINIWKSYFSYSDSKGINNYHNWSDVIYSIPINNNYN
jgi:hypothetical protein